MSKRSRNEFYDEVIGTLNHKIRDNLSHDAPTSHLKEEKRNVELKQLDEYLVENPQAAQSAIDRYDTK